MIPEKYCSESFFKLDMTSRIGELKLQVIKQVEEQRDKLVGISRTIHDNPELGFNEKKASSLLSGFLKGCGFRIEDVAGFPTSFRATYGKGKPVIGLLAEYDALPELGHACGHNIIASAAAGAAVASKCAVDEFGGSVTVLGTPAEELSGGKIQMLGSGALKNLDVAMLVHPGSKNLATVKALACATLEAEFQGKAAHAAGHPDLGVNALDAMVLAYNAISVLRQHIRDGSRIHGIITNGGKAANIVPDFASALFMVRSDDKEYLIELQKKVLACFEGAAAATGAKFMYRWNKEVYYPMKNNMFLAGLFMQNMQSLSREVVLYDPDYGFGSTDMGNVSQEIPAIHPEIAISVANVHTPEFALAAVSDTGNVGVLDGAKTLAMTVVDLLGEPSNLAAIRAEFNRK
jgi:amidohydrolase